MLLLVLSISVYCLAVYVVAISAGFDENQSVDKMQSEFEYLKLMFNAKAAAKLVCCKKLNKIEDVNFFVTDSKIIISTEKNFYEIPGECIVSAVTRTDEEMEPMQKKLMGLMIKKLKMIVTSGKKKSMQYLVIGYKNKSKKYKVLTFHSSAIPDNIIQSVNNLMI
ncbi:MAG TPA: hypothetical protein DCG38_12190 [Eubacteriaceae bacterium]|jgi:hypothetical protein|nr:hypothetical protein [Eubacteriaceae bacterium]